MEMYNKYRGPALIAVIIIFASVFSASTAYGQRSQSSVSQTSPRSTRVSAKLKAQMCDPSNPSLKVVNTTEARICNIAKTVKSVPTTGVTKLAPSTSAVSQPLATKTPKSTSIAVGPALPSQQIGSQNSVTSRSGDTATSAVNNLNSRSLTAVPAIAPLADALNRQQEQLQQLAAKSNDTATQNYTLASTTAATPTGNLPFLGYHGHASIKSTTSTTSDHDSDSKDKNSSDKKSDSRHTTTRNSDSKEKNSSDNKKTDSRSETNSHEHKNDSNKGKQSHGSGNSLKGIIKRALK